jgi:hypothetical protein
MATPPKTNHGIINPNPEFLIFGMPFYFAESAFGSPDSSEREVEQED